MFHLDLFFNRPFVFCGRQRDWIKALLLEGDGFVLLYKRVEDGAYQWPRNRQEIQQLSWKEFGWLLDGLKPEQPAVLRRSERRVL